MRDDISPDLESIASRYAHGECAAFAVAAHRFFMERSPCEDWRIAVFFSGITPIHAALESPSASVFFDACGYVRFEDIEARYHGAQSQGLDVGWHSEDELKELFIFEEPDIEEAHEHLEMLLPLVSDSCLITSESAKPQTSDPTPLETSAYG